MRNFDAWLNTFVKNIYDYNFTLISIRFIRMPQGLNMNTIF